MKNNEKLITINRILAISGTTVDPSEISTGKKTKTI